MLDEQRPMLSLNIWVDGSLRVKQTPVISFKKLAEQDRARVQLFAHEHRPVCRWRWVMDTFQKPQKKVVRTRV